MKKYLVLIAAAITLGFASCGEEDCNHGGITNIEETTSLEGSWYNEEMNEEDFYVEMLGEYLKSDKVSKLELLFADRGYISQKLFEKLYAKEITLVMRAKKNMKNKLTTRRYNEVVKKAEDKIQKQEDKLSKAKKDIDKGKKESVEIKWG